MLHLTLASVLLLAVPVLSCATLTKPVAESLHVPSVETQYDLAFSKTFPR
jgi:hypothetical protein